MSAEVLTVPAVAKLLDCTEATVRERAAEGTLPGLKIGRDWVFPAAALIEALNEQARTAAKDRRGPRKAPPSAVLQEVRRRAPPALP